MRKVNQLKAGALLSYISLGLSSFISILYTPIMIRILGKSEYGLFNLSSSIIGYLGVLDFGLANAVVRYTARYRALDDKEGEENLLGMFIIIYSILAIIILLAGSILVVNTDKFFSKSLILEELGKMKIIMAVMVFNLAISFPFGIFGGIITAYEHFVFPKIVGIVRAIINPLIILPLLFMGYKSIGMSIATTVVNILCITINVYYCFKVLKIKIKFKSLDFKVLRGISGYSFFIFLNIVIDKIYWSTDQFVLGVVAGTVAVAIYSVGSQLNMYYMNFSTAISGVFLPKVTKMVAQDASDEELSDFFIKTGRIQYILMSLIMSGFILFGRDFINTWAGEGYDEAFFIALVVMLPLTVPLIQNIGITILQAKNMHRFRSNVYIGIALINLAFSIPMAKALGGFGAALATGISMIIGNIIIINIYYYKKIKIDIPRFWREIFFMTIPVALSMGVGVVINSFINLSGYIGLAVKGSIFSAIFIILMWVIGMNTYEKELFIGPINLIKDKILLKVLRGN